MAVYSLLFGHAEWPEERARPRDPLPVPERERTRRLRVTVPEALERRVEASAELAGMSPETWIVCALLRSVDPRLVEVS